MNWKEIRSKRWYKILTNKYVFISIVFLVWILFLDANAWLVSHREINQQIADKKEDVQFFEKGIARDKARLKQLSDSNGLEKFARERYLMKKYNEEVYIIEYPDSIKQ